ncbi:MAG: ABC-F family ATP-binding cassette domain-containing protein [Alphaproteobacteria bacterium]|jgi:ATP-binding cassette subfamily F protein 3|nr:ABC-F family ATP-binding cassette domain-containing protein [Alphaproteobacteria bacterium]
MLIQISNAYKAFSGKLLFQNVSFNIDDRDKIGLIGINGAGKSTLIKILMGLEELDVNPNTRTVGNINKNSDVRVGYLSQHSNLNPDNTILQELAPLVDVSEEYKIHIALGEVGLEEILWHNQISTLSGGQQTKVSLCKILLEEPSLLILDEPTNHLDLEAIEWLESFLKNYKKAFLLISHDKYFLDNTVSRIFEIEGNTLKAYKGNYSDFVIQKEIFLSGALKQFTQEQEQIKKLEEFVLKYKAGQKSKQARGRQKFLDRMEKADNPIIKNKTMRLQFIAGEASTKKVVEIKGLAKSFGDNLLFKNFNLTLEKGDRIALIGRNGIGKSTILRIINNLEAADSGEVSFGEKLKIGYFDQHHAGLYLENTALEEIINNFDVSEEAARGLLGQMLFSQDDVFKKVKALSGGERARISLLKLILQKPNFLILDEPTNHLDIYSREILEEAFDGFEGTILAVSHDRSFLANVVDKICVIDRLSAKLFDGSYDEYVEQRDSAIVVKGSAKKEVKPSNESFLLQKEKSNLEKSLQKLDKEEKALQAQLEKAGAANNLAELVDLQSKIEDVNAKMLQVLEEIDNIEQKIG